MHISSVNDYLSKPFSNEEFVTSLNKVLVKINSKNLMIDRNNELKETYKKISPYVEKKMVAKILKALTKIKH